MTELTAHQVAELGTKLGELEATLSNLDDYKTNLDSELGEAWNQADQAEDYAGYCKNSLEEAQSSKDHIEEEVGNLSGKIEELRGMLTDASSASGGDLSTDIAKYRNRVQSMLNSGVPAGRIARELNISEVLVDQIVRQIQRAAA